MGADLPGSGVEIHKIMFPDHTIWSCLALGQVAPVGAQTKGAESLAFGGGGGGSGRGDSPDASPLEVGLGPAAAGAPVSPSARRSEPVPPAPADSPDLGRAAWSAARSALRPQEGRR